MKYLKHAFTAVIFTAFLLSSSITVRAEYKTTLYIASTTFRVVFKPEVIEPEVIIIEITEPEVSEPIESEITESEEPEEIEPIEPAEVEPAEPEESEPEESKPIEPIEPEESETKGSEEMQIDKETSYKMTLAFINSIENEVIRQKCIEAINYSNHEMEKIQDTQKGSEDNEEIVL